MELKEEEKSIIEEHKSCFGHYYNDLGNACENGSSGLCSYCDECQQQDINY